MKVKSFIKYPGGKSKLINKLSENMPEISENYFEPFIGGGAFLFHILNEKKCNKKHSISDINKNLINCYTIIKDHVIELIEELKKETYVNESTYFYENRIRYNEIKFLETNLTEQAALFIYLNKCCYNGMIRENKNGKYNVPFGKMKNPLICDELLLKNVSEILNNNDTEIKCIDYKEILNTVNENDFCYMDPPYHNTFTDYTANKFEEEHQKELKIFVDLLTEKKVKVMVSNSNTDFIKELYKDYTTIEIDTSYSVNSNGNNRNNKKEILIKNF